MENFLSDSASKTIDSSRKLQSLIMTIHTQFEILNNAIDTEVSQVTVETISKIKVQIVENTIKLAKQASKTSNIHDYTSSLMQLRTQFNSLSSHELEQQSVSSFPKELDLLIDFLLHATDIESKTVATLTKEYLQYKLDFNLGIVSIVGGTVMAYKTYSDVRADAKLLESLPNRSLNTHEMSFIGYGLATAAVVLGIFTVYVSYKNMKNRKDEVLQNVNLYYNSLLEKENQEADTDKDQDKDQDKEIS
jgi:hypothetical protein